VVQRTQNRLEVIDYCACAHHGWNTQAVVLDGRADGLNPDSQLFEVTREPRLRQEEQRFYAVQARKLDGAEIKTDRNKWKTRMAYHDKI